ncbi:MAG TPA: hypothetical protein VFC34_05725, partial [Puia sp.]|nr:hypothetical protein [Puia sp.]
MGKALYEESLVNDACVQVSSMYDHGADSFDNAYFPAENFSGYGINKVKFFWQMVNRGRKKDRLILSHINLLPVGWLIKKCSPRTELILLAHGIEIWYPLSAFKRKMLFQCDRILAVSEFTKARVNEVHGFSMAKLSVLN